MATINSIGTPYPLEPEDGGTGVITLTDHAVLVGSGTADITSLAVGATGEALLGVTGADPAWGAIDLSSTVTGILPVDGGGTGVNTLADHGILLGSGAADVTVLAAATNGQIPIGSTGADPVLAVITGGDHLTVTNGAGTISLEGSQTAHAFTGFLSWDGGAPYYDDTTLGQFTLQQSGSGYIEGVLKTWTQPQTVTGMTSGNTYYIYIDTNGVLQKTATYSESLYVDNIVLFECWRDAALPANNQSTVKENHPYNFPAETSNYLHNTVGVVIENASGGANITLNGTQKIEISGADELEDHGLETTIPDSGGVAESFAKLYTNAAGKWVKHSTTDTFSGNYNNAGVVTALGANKYGTYTLYVGKDTLNTATPRFGAVMNTSQFNNLAAARLAITTGAVSIATNELYAMEQCRLGYIIYSEASSSIVQVIIDKNTLRSSSSTTGTNIASLINTTTTNFDGILSAANTNVQSALETIDDWGKTTTDHALLIANGTGVALGSLAVGATGETLMGSTGADPGWTSSPSFGGSVTAATGLTVTANDIAISSGKLTMPATTSADGQITIGGNRFLHAYGNATYRNTFIGDGSGNFTLNTGLIPTGSTSNVGVGRNTLQGLTDSGNDNCAIGSQCLKACTSGETNCGLGSDTLLKLTSGEGNSGFGYDVLANLLTGKRNLAFGYRSGDNYTGAESSNILLSSAGVLGESNIIRLGTQGSGDGEQDKAFMAGIYNVTPSGGNDGTVIIDSNGQLGSTTSPTSVLTLNAQTGIAYTLVLADQSKLITLTNAAAITLTIPTNAAVALPIGTQILLYQGGAGTVTVAGAGVTIRSADSLLDLYTQYSVATLTKLLTDTWVLMGDIA